MREEAAIRQMLEEARYKLQLAEENGLETCHLAGTIAVVAALSWAVGDYEDSPGILRQMDIEWNRTIAGTQLVEVTFGGKDHE